MNKYDHKFVGVILHTGYVESASMAGTVIGCKQEVFYRDPVKLLKNLAYCFSVAYIREWDEQRQWGRKNYWLADDDDRYEDFMNYVEKILQGTNNDQGFFPEVIEYSPFELWENSLKTTGDWLIVYENSEAILASLAFGKSWGERYNYESKEVFGVTTVSDYKEIYVKV